MNSGKIHLRVYAVVFFILSLASSLSFPFNNDFRTSWPFILSNLLFASLLFFISFWLWNLNYRGRYAVLMMAGLGTIVIGFFLMLINAFSNPESWLNTLYILTILLYIYGAILVNYYKKEFSQ